MLSILLHQLYYSLPLVSHYFLSFVFFSPFDYYPSQWEPEQCCFLALAESGQEELVIWMVVHRLPTSLRDHSSCHGQGTHLQCPQPFFLNFSTTRLISW